MNSIGRVLAGQCSAEFVEESRGQIPKDSRYYFRYNGKSLGSFGEDMT